MNLILFDKINIINIMFALILISIPFPFIVNSIIIIAFVLFYILYFRTNFVFNFNWYLIFPICFFIIMMGSILFAYPNENYFKGLQKNLPFLIFPIIFLNKSLSKLLIYNKVIYYFSVSQVIFAIYYISHAFFLFLKTNNKNVFFFQNLVGIDQNAIYFSVYASMGMFYFYIQKGKSIRSRICFYILLFFVFLLSSKTFFLINTILFVLHYFFFSNSEKSIKTLTLFCGIVFILFSVFFVPQVNTRVVEEYQTAFIDNTINNVYSTKSQKTYNISLKDAWSKKCFTENQYLPGTAYRVFQIRAFKEVMNNYDKWYFGFGLNNVDFVLKKTYQKYNLFSNQKYQNFHNQYIQSFSELGVFGFLILTLILFKSIISAIKNKNFLNLVFSLSMILFLLTESFLIRQRGIVYFIVFYCLFSLLNTSNKQNEENSYNRCSRVFRFTSLRSIY